MEKIRVYKASVAANTNDAVLGSLTVPVGHRYDGKELNVLAPAGTLVHVYVEDEHMVDIDGDVQPDTQRRVVNWPTKDGLTFRFYASNETGGALECGIEFSYDDVLV